MFFFVFFFRVGPSLYRPSHLPSPTKFRGRTSLYFIFARDFAGTSLGLRRDFAGTSLGLRRDVAGTSLGLRCTSSSPGTSLYFIFARDFAVLHLRRGLRWIGGKRSAGEGRPPRWSSQRGKNGLVDLTIWELFFICKRGNIHLSILASKFYISLHNYYNQVPNNNVAKIRSSTTSFVIRVN